MLHTHYDNLKVARRAPQEVIRAAYKALSQKYHPDKNPGDAKSARVMAMVNSAYTILADPQLRREHDEWIAAAEREIAWQANRQTLRAKEREGAPAKVAYGGRWWLLVSAGIGVCVGIGVGLGVAALAMTSGLPEPVRHEVQQEVQQKGQHEAQHEAQHEVRRGVDAAICVAGCLRPAVQR